MLIMAMGRDEVRAAVILLAGAVVLGGCVTERAKPATIFMGDRESSVPSLRGMSGRLTETEVDCPLCCRRGNTGVRCWAHCPPVGTGGQAVPGRR